MPGILARLAFVGTCAAMLAAAQAGDGPGAVAVPPPAADPGGEVPSLILGVFPRRGHDTTLELFRPLADHLAATLDRRVKLVTTYDFPSFWRLVVDRRFDLVHYNQYHYVRSHSDQGYEVIAKNEEFGRSTLAPTIVVRRDSGIGKLSDLRGKRLVFGGGRRAMISYLGATFLLLQAGLDPGDYSARFALNPLRACAAVFYHQADAAGAGDITLDLPALREQIDTSQLRYVAVGPPLAHLPWAVRGDLAPDLRARIRDTLVGMAADEAGRKALRRARLTRIVPAYDGEYDPHRRIIAAVLQAANVGY